VDRSALLHPVSALAGLLVSVGPTPALVTVAERTGLGLATVTARKGTGPELAARAEQQYGLEVPSGPHRAGAGGIDFLGIGPARWLVVAEAAGPGFAADLGSALDGLASVVDQSAGYGVLRISGPKARETFEKGLPIDLHPSAFGAGDVAVTSLAHLGVTLWQVDPAPSYDIALFRSLSGSVWHWLASSAAEFGLDVTHG
jgi:methylglutamate dehydrogenase subunit D